MLQHTSEEMYGRARAGVGQVRALIHAMDVLAGVGKPLAPAPTTRA
jgi:hypothetical protein